MAMTMHPSLAVQRGQFYRQHLIVPATVGSDLVVGDHQCAALGRAEMRQDYNGCLFQPQLAGGHDAPMPRDDHAVISNQHRVHETKFCNRSCNLCNLRIRMGTSIAGMGDQSVERPKLNRSCK